MIVLSLCPLFVSCSGNVNKSENLKDIPDYYLLIGTYTNGLSKGIHVYDLSQETGDTKFVGTSPDVSNPSYLAVSADERFVYAVSEDDLEDASVNSFLFDKATGTLTFVNSRKTGGAHPCYVAVDEGNNFVTTANYTGGSVSVFPLSENGSLDSISQVFTYPERTIGNLPSHIHTTFFSPDERFLFVTDLGKDRIYRYTVNKSPENQSFLQDPQIVAELEAGSGPRHLALHPNEHSMYCINELSGKITVFRYNDGFLNTIQSIDSDTTSGNVKKGSADIHLTPDGKFLYSSNRLKADGIAVFKVNDDGSLTSIGYQTTGIHPRNFMITPNGKFLLVASRDSNCIDVFSINPETGLLSDTGNKIEIDKPVCLKLILKNSH